jgi:hypothetical protein
LLALAERRTQADFFDYEGFVEKFKPKKTTDDCYTPPNVYEAVKSWAVKEYALEGREVVRPFWPGGDFEKFAYPDGCVVIDNPPFSIVTEIVRWYYAQGIDYFLFAPYLSNLGIGAGGAGVNHVIAPCNVRYENGATVPTSFVTNLGGDFIRAAPDLMDAVVAANDENLEAVRKSLPKYVYPASVLTSAAVGYLCVHHTPFAVKRGACAFIRRLDAQGDRSIFGGGYLLSERAAAERAAAERAAAERAAAERAAAHMFELSERERKMQGMLE